MNDSSFNLVRFLFDNSDPRFWQCPIQEGLPFLLGRVGTLLLWLAGLVFLVGIIMATFYYLTAYGDENRAKRGKETLKWMFIGAIVIMLSSVVIDVVVSFLAAETEKTDFGQIINTSCASQTTERSFNPNPNQVGPAKPGKLK